MILFATLCCIVALGNFVDLWVHEASPTAMLAAGIACGACSVWTAMLLKADHQDPNPRA